MGTTIEFWLYVTDWSGTRLAGRYHSEGEAENWAYTACGRSAGPVRAEVRKVFVPAANRATPDASQREPPPPITGDLIEEVRRSYGSQVTDEALRPIRDLWERRVDDTDA